MRMTARRIRDGQALAEAMRDYPGGITLTELAARTGVSFQLIGLLRMPSTAGTSGSGPNKTRRYRTTTTPETADRIEDALDVRRGTLFNREEIPEPGDPPAAIAPILRDLERGVPEARFSAG